MEQPEESVCSIGRTSFLEVLSIFYATIFFINKYIFSVSSLKQKLRKSSYPGSQLISALQHSADLLATAGNDEAPEHR